MSKHSVRPSADTYSGMCEYRAGRDDANYHARLFGYVCVEDSMHCVQWVQIICRLISTHHPGSSSVGTLLAAAAKQTFSKMLFPALMVPQMHFPPSLSLSLLHFFVACYPDYSPSIKLMQELACKNPVVIH